MRPVRSKGMNLGRWKELDAKEIDNEASDRVEEGSRLAELGKRFASDKGKIEDEIEKVNNSKISAEDKASLIRELNTAMDALETQYMDDVAQEEERVQEEIEVQIESMDEAAEEMEGQIDSLKSVTMDVASVDMDSAISEGEEKVKEFLRMKNDYTEKLKLQMEQAEMMRRHMRARRLSGK